MGRRQVGYGHEEGSEAITLGVGRNPASELRLALPSSRTQIALQRTQGKGESNGEWLTLKYA